MVCGNHTNTNSAGTDTKGLQFIVRNCPLCKKKDAKCFGMYQDWLDVLRERLQVLTDEYWPDPDNKTTSESRAGSPTNQKKVDFDLSATSKQDFYEYRRKVKRGKYPNPFDASKKPAQGVLKYSTPSPINPLYKKAYNINYWTPTVSSVQMIEQMDAMDTADAEIYVGS